MSERHEQHRGGWVELERGVKKFGRHIKELDRHATWVEPPAELEAEIIQSIKEQSEAADNEDQPA